MLILGKEIDLSFFTEAGSSANHAPVVTQAEAVANVANATGSVNYTTQTSKGAASAFPLNHAQSLLAHNDALAHVVAQLESAAPALTTVAASAVAVVQGLPFLGLSAVRTSAMVIHVELTGDFAPVVALRDLGLPILISHSVKEAQDLSLVAYAYAAHARTTVLHFLAPAPAARLAVVDAATVAAFVTTDAAPDAAAVFDTLAALLHNVGYAPFDVAGPRDAADAVVVLGAAPAWTAAGTAAVATIRLYRPFAPTALVEALPRTVRTVTVVEQTARARAFSPLLLDLFAAPALLTTRGIATVVAASVGDATDAALAEIIANAQLAAPVQNLAVGGPLAGDASSAASGAATAAAQSLEAPYLAMLESVSPHLALLNTAGASSVGDAANPEFGYGAFLFREEQRGLLRAAVQAAVGLGQCAPGALRDFSEWLLSGAVAPTLVEEAAAFAEVYRLREYFAPASLWIVGSDAWAYDLGSSGVHHVIASGRNVNMLLIDSTPAGEESAARAARAAGGVGADAARAAPRANATVGAADATQVAAPAAPAAGAADATPATPATPAAPRKKDVGLYAMNFGGCYVASVAVYALYTQVLQAFIEAERFNGPSLVLAYLPYHTEADDTLVVLQETKRAVDAGRWPLYRYAPGADEPFTLDLSAVRGELEAFLARENQLTMLARRDPVLARSLAASQAGDVRAQQASRARAAYAQLVAGLAGPPVLVAFASDGGVAEALARRVARQAVGRGLQARAVAMDELEAEELAAEANVLLITSTAGQGEFPQNGRALWEALRGATDLDLSRTRVAVFGLGDLQYWPREADAHYYNKPARELQARVAALGAVELAALGLGDDQDADGVATGYDAWIGAVWAALGVAGAAGVEEPRPLTNEDMKRDSDFLRGTIAPALVDDTTGAISAVDQQLTKFHGIYMQDDRDIREQRKAEGREPAYLFMVRVRLAGGVALARQYLRMDELADERGNGTLKITTRATFQLHGVVKHDLKPAIRGMNAALMDTLAACGDVNRNVMCSALPGNRAVHGQVQRDAQLISEHLLPRTTAYHEIWLEGADAGDGADYEAAWGARREGPTKTKTLVAGNALVDVEPLYKNLYLPRKFKVVITVPPFNDVDVYAHDVGLIAIVENNVVLGYNVLAGGGMGSTHNNKSTYPRAGSMMGYCAAADVHVACEAIMLVQRDNGDRTNRKHARLKYTVDLMGVKAFKAAVEAQWGQSFGAPREFSITSNIDYFGWTTDETGLHHFTCFIENGRIEDTVALPQKRGLQAIAHFMLENDFGNFRLTGNQHLLISDVPSIHLEAVKALMKTYALDNTNFSALRLGSSACVAFPTCGLAMAESERYLPSLVAKLEGALEEYGLRHDSVTMRMTGCPNGCARPWLAEVALVGKAAGAYNLLLGGGYHGQRLNKIYRYSIKEEEILDTLRPLFKRWALERLDGEHFGDFVIRVGVIKPTLEGKYFHDDIPEDA